MCCSLFCAGPLLHFYIILVGVELSYVLGIPDAEHVEFAVWCGVVWCGNIEGPDEMSIVSFDLPFWAIQTRRDASGLLTVLFHSSRDARRPNGTGRDTSMLWKGTKSLTIWMAQKSVGYTSGNGE